MSGPLTGVTIVELAGLGALPFGTLKLADMGADVIRVDRAGEVPAHATRSAAGVLGVGPRPPSIGVDLKHPDGVEVVLRLAARADALLESFRPGVAERLGVGPDAALARNPKLVYGRLTGWGQDGPLAHSAAHSLNYESITGAIGSVGAPHGAPVPVLQVLGDFAGGGLHLAYGVVCALFEAQRSGQGQVVDAAMVDGVASIFSVFYGMAAFGHAHRRHRHQPVRRRLRRSTPCTRPPTAGTSRLAPIEPHFYAQLLEQLGIAGDDLPAAVRPVALARDEGAHRGRGAHEDARRVGGAARGTDVCFAPVYRFGEAHEHPHNVARDLFVPTPDGGRQVAPAPRFSRTVPEPGDSYAYPGVDTDARARRVRLRRRRGVEAAGRRARSPEAPARQA